MQLDLRGFEILIEEYEYPLLIVLAILVVIGLVLWKLG